MSIPLTLFEGAYYLVVVYLYQFTEVDIQLKVFLVVYVFDGLLERSLLRKVKNIKNNT